MDRPHYEKKEQVVCAVEGIVKMAIVPHVFRQEVYAGKVEKSEIYHDSTATPFQEVNVSPVNFFLPKLKEFPNFKSDEMKHTVTL